MSLLLASGCGSSGDGTAAPRQGTPTAATKPPVTASSTDTTTPPVAPPVPEPLTTGPFETDPCLLLTDARAAGLGDGNGWTYTRDKPPLVCHWARTHPAFKSFQAHIVSTGLQQIYDDHAARKYDARYLEPATIAGHPAAFTSPGPLPKAQAICLLSVGLSNDRRLDLDGERTEPRAPGTACDGLDTIATAILETIRETK